MTRQNGPTAVTLAAGVLGAALAVAAPAPQETTEMIKDRASFIPKQKHQPLPGKVIGVVVADVVAMMSQEGRGGPPRAHGFSHNGNSYRWMYVPVAEKELITNLAVQIGEKGDRSKSYPRLSMAFPETIKQWGVDGPFALVEVEVNDQLGSPAIEGFVATKMKRLDGTQEYPFKLPDVVAEVRKKYELLMQDQQKAIAAAMAEAQQKAIKDKKPAGPQQKQELFYITWLPETQRLQLRVRTTTSDAFFEETPANQPIPLPPQPVPPQAVPPGKGAQGPGGAAFRPPPPPRDPPVIRKGVVFGVEMGFAFDVTKNGKIDRVLTLPIQTFQRDEQRVEFRRGPRPPAREVPPPRP